MTNKKYYLAHNFGSRFKVRDYIMPVLQEMYKEWDIVNPFMVDERHNEGLYDYKGTSEKDAKAIYLAEMDVDERSASIVERDLYWIDQCDMLVAYIERASVGTSMEIFYMKYVRKLPVTIVMDTDIDLIHHPWLLYFSDTIITLDKRKIYPLTDGVKIDLKVLHAFQKYGLEIAHLLAVKNVAYGKSASNLSYEGINKRINEKTMRIANLRAQGLEGNDDESMRETIIDIGGYAILQLMCHDKAFPFTEGFQEQSLLDAFTSEELAEELLSRGVELGDNFMRTKDVKLCKTCEQEVGCEYLNDGISEDCCADDDGLENGQQCGSCMSGLVSDAYDHYKDQQMRNMT